MTWLDRLMPWRQKSANSYGILRELLGRRTSHTGKVVSVNTAIQVATVFACARVIAEGIATREEEQIALEAGCDGVQGHLYAPAMPAEAIGAFLSAHDGDHFLREVRLKVAHGVLGLRRLNRKREEDQLNEYRNQDDGNANVATRHPIHRKRERVVYRCINN